MKTLSAALATCNEEENLSRCLDSIKNIADEIIVVDGSSTDKTVDIAKKYGAKVIITNNPANFHINKQKAIDACTGRWVLQLDADEVISRELSHEIKYQISKIKNENNGYWIPRKNYFLGRFLAKGGQYPDYTLRLYKKGFGKLPQKDVHEQTEVIGKVGYLASPLLHFPYKNFFSYLKKWNRYNDLLSHQIEKSLKNKNIVQHIFFTVGYFIIKPSYWFLTTFICHKGFVDSWQGFIFSLFSALRFPAAYLKFLGLKLFTKK